MLSAARWVLGATCWVLSATCWVFSELVGCLAELGKRIAAAQQAQGEYEVAPGQKYSR